MTLTIGRGRRRDATKRAAWRRGAATRGRRSAWSTNVGARVRVARGGGRRSWTPSTTRTSSTSDRIKRGGLQLASAPSDGLSGLAVTKRESVGASNLSARLLKALQKFARRKRNLVPASSAPSRRHAPLLSPRGGREGTDARGPCITTRRGACSSPRPREPTLARTLPRASSRSISFPPLTSFPSCQPRPLLAGAGGAR
jgi:hypothetical protein